MTAPNNIDLHLPPGMHYACIQCGRSCGLFEEIGVEAELVEPIRARPAAQLVGARDPRNLFVANPDKPGEHMMRLEGGACCLLGSEGLCTLHREFGFEAKPNICRSFPYRFIETPGGVFAGLSFACTAVLGRMGPAVADQRAELEAQYRWTVGKKAAGANPQLAAALPLSWAQYAAVESDLDALLALPGGDAGQRLLMQSIYLAMLVRFLRQARMATGAAVAGPEAHAAPLETFRKNMRGSGDWSPLARLAARGRASMHLRRLFLGFVLTLRHDYNARAGRLRGYFTVLRGYYRHALGRGRIALPGLSREVTQREIAAVRFDPLRPEHDELATRYFRHALFRKDLLAEDTIQFAQQMQLMRWGMLHWHAAAMAAAEAQAGAKAEIEPEHLSEAARNVERYYGMHSNFSRIFRDYPMLRVLMDRLFAKPLYAISMARGEWTAKN